MCIAMSQSLTLSLARVLFSTMCNLTEWVGAHFSTISKWLIAQRLVECLAKTNYIFVVTRVYAKRESSTSFLVVDIILFVHPG